MVFNYHFGFGKQAVYNSFVQYLNGLHFPTFLVGDLNQLPNESVPGCATADGNDFIIPFYTTITGCIELDEKSKLGSQKISLENYKANPNKYLSDHKPLLAQVTVHPHYQ